jgi:hypothetical protein
MRLIAIVGPLAALLVGCGGGGGSSGNKNPPAGPNVVISGKITFDRIPFRTTAGAGLNPDAPVESPARQVVVEVLGTSNTVLASTVTNATGDYSLTVPVQTTVFVRAKAQMLKTDAAPTWNFAVRNNANADALYVLDGSNFNSGTANSTHNLRATTGWGGSSYTGTRAAAPFAILDTVYQAKELVLSASASTVFPPLDLFWSSSNRTASNPFCPDTGNIGTSFYAGSGSTDGCTPAAALPAGIYILGDFAGGSGDTDEFDSHVIAHEFGHYVEDSFSRSDSIGGSHGSGDRLDLRLAFGEGWGNAYSAMALNDPLYRDSAAGVSGDGGFNLESDNTTTEGWFSEFSVGELLWDIFDGTAEPGDNVALGFGPIYSVMTGPQVSTDAQTSIFSFITALRAANPSASASIADVLAGESISGSDAFGTGESNAGGDATVLPIYGTISLGSPVAGVCSRSTAGSENANKLGNRRFLLFVNDQLRTVTIQATGAAPNGQSVPATDPDIYVHLRGTLAAFGESTVAGSETIPQVSLAAGTYVIEVLDFDVSGTNQPPRCMTVSIQG